jgi:23S rRNA (uracil1939-C5)-methyltransferase
LEALSVRKQQILRDALSQAGLRGDSSSTATFPKSGFRERVDLMIENSQLGYLSNNSELRSVFQLKECELLTEPLMDWVLDFQKTMPQVRKGSVRLRVSPSGLRGIWLDFSNLDVAELLKRETELQALLAAGVAVEIGQKRKRLRRVPDLGLKLRDPEAETWTETFIAGEAVSLFSLIGNFTQTGRWAHQLMSAWVEKSLESASRVIEFGSGIGTLTLPAAGSGRSVLACEVDALAIECLQKTISTVGRLNIEILRGDFQLQVKNISGSFDAFLVNPPRSGLGSFINTIAHLPELPRQGLYMSCYLESFVKDALELQKLGYTISSAEILDQFPWTNHFEILANFSRD